MKLDFEKMSGLIPAIAQDDRDASVLMLGYMNQEAFDKSLASGCMTFYSRTRQRIWTKGEESGNFLKIVSWASDCDHDTLLFRVRPAGPTCHEGTKSCFKGLASDAPRDGEGFLSELERIIDDKASRNEEGSYTAHLVGLGLAKQAQKIGEEAVETVIALLGESEDEVIQESADLLFHLLVGLRTKGVSLAKVTDCLRHRHEQKERRS